MINSFPYSDQMIHLLKKNSIQNNMKPPRAMVPWQAVMLDISLLFFAALAPIVFYKIDLSNNESDLFQRSGSLTIIIAAIVAYRSLNKHYNKIFYKSTLRTSLKQLCIDILAILLTIIGTLIWAYGDKIQ